MHPDTALEAVARRTPLQRVAPPERVAQYLEFAAIGATGSLVNTIIFLPLVAHIHYAAAGTIAFAAAVSYNFAGNYLLTFGRPDGRLRRQYLQFVAVSLGGFVIYSLTLAAAIDGLGWPPLAANIAGIVTGGIWNFVGADEFAFDDDATATSKAATSLNRCAHYAYRGPIKAALRGTPAYHLLYVAYCRAVARLTPDRYEVTAGPASATFATDTGPEAVSVLHTERKERPVLQQYAGDVLPGDVVWDIGANLGVFTLVAADLGAEVVAAEPLPATVDALRANIRRNDAENRVTVDPVVVEAESGVATLGVERREPGSQTPGVTTDAQHTVDVTQVAGDQRHQSDEWPTPDVVKIDVEGAEPAVLQGMADVLTSGRPRVVYCEAHSPGQARRVRGQLASHDYHVETIHRYDREHYLRAIPEERR